MYMNKPKFSLIVPTYNRASLIKETLKSILAQDYKDFEVIVVDDGGKDNTKEVVEAFGDPRVQYYWKENAERGAARNYGAALAKGEIINFFDSDDICYANHLSAADKYYRNESVHNTILHTSYEFLFEQKSFNRTIKEGRLNNFVFKHNTLSCNNVFIPKKIFEKNKFSEDRNLSATEDWALWLVLASQYEVMGMADVTSAVVQHDMRSMVLATGASTEKRALALEKELDKHDDKFKKFPGLKINVRAEMFSLCALHYAIEKKTKEAFRCLNIALRLRPSLVLTRRFLAIMKYVLIK